MSRTILLHRKDVILNRDNLRVILDKKDLTYIQLYESVADKYGIDLTYKGFMSLMSNRSSWKLLYAIAIIDTLKVDVGDIFDIVDVDIEKKVKDKKVWREKYER